MECRRCEALAKRDRVAFGIMGVATDRLARGKAFRVKIILFKMMREYNPSRSHVHKPHPDCPLHDAREFIGS